MMSYDGIEHGLVVTKRAARKRMAVRVVARVNHCSRVMAFCFPPPLHVRQRDHEISNRLVGLQQQDTAIDASVAIISAGTIISTYQLSRRSPQPLQAIAACRLFAILSPSLDQEDVRIHEEDPPVGKAPERNLSPRRIEKLLRLIERP
eukprot:scaffold307808_cov33-Tisochrysis_lutea.AAC.2